MSALRTLLDVAGLTAGRLACPYFDREAVIPAPHLEVKYQCATPERSVRRRRCEPVMTKRNDWPAVVGFFGIAALGSILHCSLLSGVRSWGDALPSLYCIPILIAAIKLGIRASLSVALAAGFAHALASLLGCGDFWAGALVETLLYIAVAIAAAKLTHMAAPLAATSQGSGRGQPPGGQEFAHHSPQVPSQPASLSQILAALVHRIRTPVSSIEGAVELLDDRRFPEHKRQEFIGIIRKESHHLDRALSDLLDFAQPRKPQSRQVDVSELLAEVIGRIGQRREADSRFCMEIPPNLPLLTCDPEQVGKMLFNLFMNSIQATPAGGPIAIAVHTEADSLIITIQDHGRGIAPTIAGRIFDPFFSNRENALGLGLTVARQIVSSHCGNITVMESSDKGTLLSVRLPLTPPDSHEHRPYSGG